MIFLRKSSNSKRRRTSRKRSIWKKRRTNTWQSDRQIGIIQILCRFDGQPKQILNRVPTWSKHGINCTFKITEKSPKPNAFSCIKAYVGLMLGDGCVYHHKEAMTFTFTQSDIHTKYFKFVLNVFCNVVTHSAFNQSNRDQFKHVLTFNVIRDERIRWYRSTSLHSRKKIPIDIKVSPVALAFWISDDGSDAVQSLEQIFAILILFWLQVL